MRLTEEFFHRDCLEMAPALVGKILVRTLEDGSQLRLRISETEAYRGEEDTACHAHKGRTKRTEVLYHESGRIYVYLCYGIHWLLNIVSGEKGQPQAVLIRACQNAEGPGKLTKALQVDRTFNDTSILDQKRLWIEDDGKRYQILTDTRVGIGYASKEDQNRLWRFKMGKELPLSVANKRSGSTMRKIGVTGGAGAGKSQVLHWLETHYHALIIRTDDTAKQLMEPGEEGYRRLVQVLGRSFLNSDDTINRPALAQMIFQDESARNQTNQIIHPLVWKKIQQDLKKAEKENDSLAVVESALFTPSALDFLDEMWYIYAPEEIRIKRLMENRGYSHKRCQSMIASQLTHIDFLAFSTQVIDNSSTWEDTVKQLETITIHWHP